MHRIKSLVVILLALFMVAGCGKFKSFGSKKTDDWTAEQFYNAAKAKLDKEDWQEAAELFEQLEARYPYGPYSEQGQLEIAYAYHKNDEPELALTAVDRFVRLHPTHPHADYAYYLKGLVNFAEHKNLIDKVLGSRDFSDRDPQATRDSYLAFKELLDRYPNSNYVGDTRKRVQVLLNSLARHDIHVADYYLRRGAYVAVVNRCKYVLENYQQTAAAEDALGMMIAAYTRMGMADLAADSKRVLEMNYPRSSYLDDERAAGKKRFRLFKRKKKKASG